MNKNQLIALTIIVVALIVGIYGSLTVSVYADGRAQVKCIDAGGDWTDMSGNSVSVNMGCDMP